jgi:prolyl-tRNA synthetase
MRTRLCLRTAEFLWQEGHTAHSTKEEAMEETVKMLGVYAEFAEKYLALPVIKGVKTENERFAGAVETYCIEAMMQDGKALQAGTSHFLGQNFAKAFDVKFANKEGVLEHVWGTSWGVSTRLMGALIMAHSDDNGLVLPPKLAPHQVVIVPIVFGDDNQALFEKCEEIKKILQDAGISVLLDKRDTHKPGWKFSEYELKGVPVRLAIGNRDLENNQIELARRDTLSKTSVPIEGLADRILSLLDEIQDNIYQKALNFRTMNTKKVDDYETFKKELDENPGFILAHWDGSAETEEKIKNETKATIRCIPLEREDKTGVCMVSGKPSAGRVVFARAY